MIDRTLKVSLTLRGPILTGATTLTQPGVDSPMARTANGVPYLPFSLVKGRFKEALQELASCVAGTSTPWEQALDWQYLLGNSSDEGNGFYDPSRGRLQFSDFQYSEAQAPSDPLFRIKIDDYRGAVQRGALQVLETPFAPGKEVCFTGTVRLLAASPEDADRIEKTIKKAFQWITSFGAERTSGFGQLLRVEITHTERSPTLAQTETTPLQTAFWMKLDFDSPFCVSHKRVTPNVFESEEVIGGHVIRGSLATMLKLGLGLATKDDLTQAQVPEAWQTLCRHFNKLRIGFALPTATEKTLPVYCPLSLVTTSSDISSDAETKPPGLWDVALLSEPQLIDDQLPAFQTDWKDSSPIRSRFGWPKLAKEMRVRTQISPQLRRAKDENLFAYEMVRPENVTWMAKVDVSEVPEDDRDAFVEQLRALLAEGLGFLGKTKARATVQFLPNGACQFKSHSQIAPLDESRWVITLQSPTILCSPEKAGPINEQELLEHFRAVWSELSGGLLKLDWYYASHSLSGGYVAKRYRPLGYYHPFLLTDPGSVFVLSWGSDQNTPEAKSAAETKINDWLKFGLPLPSWTKSLYGDDWEDDWRQNPFRRRDGFGAIAVNLPCHTDWKPESSYAG